MDERKEKRNRKAVLAMLLSATEPLAIALASTENVSPCGMRAQTDRPWKPDTRLLVETSLHERSSTARCRSASKFTLSDSSEARVFAVGGEALPQAGETDPQQATLGDRAAISPPHNFQHRET